MARSSLVSISRRRAVPRVRSVALPHLRRCQRFERHLAARKITASSHFKRASGRISTAISDAQIAPGLLSLLHGRRLEIDGQNGTWTSYMDLRSAAIRRPCIVCWHELLILLLLITVIMFSLIFQTGFGRYHHVGHGQVPSDEVKHLTEGAFAGVVSSSM